MCVFVTVKQNLSADESGRCLNHERVVIAGQDLFITRSVRFRVQFEVLAVKTTNYCWF